MKNKDMHGRIRKVKVLGGRLKKKAKDKGLSGLVFVETEIKEGELPKYHLTNIEGSPTEFLKERFLGEEVNEDD